MAEIASFGVNVDQNTRLAQNAQDTANTANGGVNNINDPNKLAPAEKATLKRKYDTDVLLYGMDTKKLTDNQLSTSEIDSAMNALTAYMTPFFANMTSTDTVDRDTLNTVYKNFDTADKDSDSAFTNMVSNTASDALSAGNQAKKAGSEAVVAVNQASEAANKANVAQSSVATAIAKAGFANDTASTASQVANDAKTIASQADNNVAIAKNDAANALTSAATAFNTAAKAQSAADNAFSKAQAVGSQASAEIAVQSNATAKAQSTADNAFSQATTAIDNGKVTSQAVTDLKDGSKLTIAELENGLATKVANSDYASYKEQTASQIGQLVTNGAFSAYQTQTADLIAQKVATKDFSAYQATTSKSIDSKVESKDFNTYKTQTDKAILSKVSSTDFNNLTISNRNLALGTATPFKMTGNGSTNNAKHMYSTSGTIAKETTVTVSFDMTAQNPTGTCTFQFAGGSWQSSDAFQLVSGTQHHSYTFVINDDYSDGVRLRLDNSTSTVTVSNLIISESSKEVSWTPAPEDLATQSQITQLSGEIEQKVNSGDFSSYKTETADLIASKVANKDFTAYQATTAKSIDSKVDNGDFSTYKTQTDKDIASKVSSGDFESYKTQTADAISSKVSQDTYDTLAGTVGQVSTLSKQNQSELVTKADSQAVDTLKQRVTTAENKLTQTATETELQQTKTDVDKLNNSVNTNASNITAQAGKIDGLLSTTKNVGDKLTTLSGKFNLSSQQLATTMSKVDGMSIGGRNYVLNSDFYISGNNTNKSNLVSSVNISTFSNKKIIVSVQIDIDNVTALTTDANYNRAGFEVKLKYTDGSYMYCGAWWYPKVGDSYHGRYYQAWDLSNQTFADTTALLEGVYVQGIAADSISVGRPKLEIATVATDWSPAPEDQATVTALTQVKQTAEGASQLSKDNHGNILALQSTAKGLQTSVSNAATKDQLNILSDTFSNKISSATSAANSKMIQTINNVGIGFKNPDGSKFQMNLSADGTALMDFSKIMLNGQTNIANGTIGNAQIANGAINQAKIANAAIGSAQIKDLAVTNAKIGNLDAGKITTGILDASHLNAGDIVANVINGKTITGITINTPTLNLGTNGTLTTSFNLNQATSLYAPKKGTGTLRIGTGVIKARSDNMSRYSNTKGYWYGFDDNGSMVKNGTNHTGDDYAPGYEKHDIMKPNGNILNRSFLDATALAMKEGGTQTFNTMLTAIGLETGNALLHQDLATEGTFEARLGTGNKYGFKIDRQVISPMIRANHYTYAADVFISRYGTMGLSTSTKVNKLDIADVPDMLQKGYNLLTLNPRQWFDKTSVEAYADVQAGNTDSVESVVDIKPVSGLVAEEVASAGLDDYVIKDENNKVQGLAYDRLWTLLLPVLRDMNDRLNEAQLEITKLKRGCLK